MERTEKISKLNIDAVNKARAHWDSIAKPLHSLGLLEEAVSKIAGITGEPRVSIKNRYAVVMCADNGVVEEGVTQSDSGVTAIVAKAMAAGDGNINALAEVCKATVVPVDIGIKGSVCQEISIEALGKVLKEKKAAGILGHTPLVDLKVAEGTKNMAREPAMTPEQAGEAIKRGMDLVKCLKEQGCDIIVTGEMGIGNTTTSSAIAAVLLNEPPEAVTGRGAGLSSEGLGRKTEVIGKALMLHGYENRRVKDRASCGCKYISSDEALRLLACVGGYDIAGMTGLFLGGGVYHIPIVIDGLISAAAAALAVCINKNALDYMLCSHVSAEPAGERLLDFIGLKPLLRAKMCLGEGAGGIMLLPLLDCALSVYNSGHSFDNLHIEQYEDYK